ncbi:MAG: hypothetical protein ND895_04350 [Pyrinomonadaceae bacterium]|nr:hypothetical protein [Pyrinomonadaceae bacterium]
MSQTPLAAMGQNTPPRLFWPLRRNPNLSLDKETSLKIPVAALPPDVRLWLRPADQLQESVGLRPWFGLRPSQVNLEAN